jgi:hypothetical protein
MIKTGTQEVIRQVHERARDSGEEAHWLDCVGSLKHFPFGVAYDIHGIFAF